MQQENRSYWLPNRVALVTTLGLALLGTPAIAFAADNGMATTAETDSVAAIVGKRSTHLFTNGQFGHHG